MKKRHLVRLIVHRQVKETVAERQSPGIRQLADGAMNHMDHGVENSAKNPGEYRGAAYIGLPARAGDGGDRVLTETSATRAPAYQRCPHEDSSSALL